MADNDPADRERTGESPQPGDRDGTDTKRAKTTVQREVDEFSGLGAGPLDESLLATQVQAPQSSDRPSADRAASDGGSASSDRGSSDRGSSDRGSSGRLHESVGESGSKPVAPAVGSAKPLPEYLEQFRILKELGSGAFGVVYMAEDESLQRRVAIKVPKVSDPQQAASYLNEARKAAAIECEGIVPIYHVGTQANGVPFVVQKLIDGPSMRELLRSHGALPPAHAVTLMRDVARALAVAHQRGIFHRDLKPDNVLVDSRGVPWIADFGLAISENEQVLQTSQLAGTLAYMSPEQIEGHVDWIDGRTDIWALGIMLYELLSGRPPFEGRTRQSLMQQICHRDPRPLQQRSAELPPELDDVFLGCCAKRPSDRFASAEQLANSLSRLIEQGLSAVPIDGSELKSNQTLSQYLSLQRSGNVASLPASLSTRSSLGRLAARSESGHRSGGASAPAAVSSASAPAGPGAGAVTPLAATPAVAHGSPAGGRSPRRIFALLLSGIVMVAAAILGAMLSYWPGRQDTVAQHEPQALSEPSPAEPPLPGPGTAQANEPGEAGLATSLPVPKSPGDPIIHPSEQPPAEMSPAASTTVPAIEADGSAELPWIVAADGSGSHPSILAAIADSIAGDTIHIRPGIYTEAVRISMPLTLVGLGERGDAQIQNNTDAPLEIVCGVGTVRLLGLEVRGDGRRTGTEFNAINLVQGRLKIENCDIRSRTWNSIRMSPGTTLLAQGCHFLDSNQFAIVAKGHAALTVEDCQFYESGMQVIDGTATASGCEFRGREGIYVQRSGGVATIAQRCRFEDCSKYGIAATESGQVDVSDCSFSRCRIGVETFRSGEAVIRGGKFENCQRAISVIDAAVSLTDNSTISGGQFGATLLGGRLRLANVELSGASQHGVSVEREGTLEIIDSQFADCQECGLSMSGGSLKIERSSIRQSEFAGIYLSGAFSKGEMRSVELRDNRELGLVMESGQLLCEQVRFLGGKLGLSLIPPADQTAKLSLRGVQFERQAEAAGMFANGSVVELSDVEPADVPLEQLFRFADNVTVKKDR